jgi:nucleoside-triphosphatase
MHLTNNHIFLLTGKARADRCGGFYTEEVREAAGGERIGFRCIELGVGGRQEWIAHIDFYLPCRIGRYGVDVERFEQIALSSIPASIKGHTVTVIDEIGPMQLLSAPFYSRIQELFHSQTNRRAVILATICVEERSEVVKIKQLPGVRLYTITPDNRDTITEEMAEAIKGIIQPGGTRI